MRHLLAPVDSTNEAYIGSRVRGQMKGTSVTVVLIGSNTAASDWCAKEIGWSLSKSPPNGLVGIRIDPDAKIPAALRDYGAEIIDWTVPSDVAQFEDAIERAALRASRGAAIATSPAGGSDCGR